jgi:glycosyltransferase involved in cell wall biosynthesis
MNRPLFSVIVPTYGRPGQLTTCLQALAHLRYPREQFEVIVVDDGSTLPLAGVVAACQDRLDVTLLRQAHAGPAAARNTGAAHATGQIFAFTDDDCRPAHDWLQTLQLRFTSAPPQIVGGRTCNALPANPYSAASQLILDMVYGYYNADPGQARFFASNNLALPASHFRAIGGFDASFTTSEDRELCDRWLHYGYGMTYAPEVIVYHAHALTLRTFWWQHFNYGRGAFCFHRIRARRGSGRFRQELKFYTRLPLLLGRSLSQEPGRRRLLLSALLLVWQGANTAGFFWEKIQQAKLLGD